ncbi:unnamed protein product [Caenorhabditis bovis]|uniref:Protein kinase domain-containing protein n=1 Tax=Caenorhabditis bovis TaxID=2654633 RepID=A0A8S1FAG0_9PELO|nr:unnamed protein product [Caenorhabditis bovis]
MNVFSLNANAKSLIPVEHQLVSHRGPYIGLRKCGVCRRFLMYFAMKKEDTFMCNVCGVRVHTSCVNKLTNNCLITTQLVGGLVHNAIVNSNWQRWETPVPVKEASAIRPTATPRVAEVKRVHTICEENEEERITTWNDVTIQLKDIIVKDVVGKGFFGRVHSGVYHGDVAVKYIHMDHIEKTRRYEIFKNEIVAAYKNSRHNHITLFLGFFADVPTNTYAIVTNFYHGSNLYSRIHETTEELDSVWILNVSLQICQAMSYLHKKQILHKDLRSKNILFDNFNNACVSDFALFRFDRLLQKRQSFIRVPDHWVDYISPEIATSLYVSNGVFVEIDMPFSFESDVYAFGTIFYELIMRQMPSAGRPWEVRMYEKISGTKGTMRQYEPVAMQRTDLRLAKTLMNCWSYEPENRPSFKDVVKDLTESRKRKESSARNSIRCFESTF